MIRATCQRWRNLVSRLIAAVLGGYLLATLFSVAVLVLPIAKTEAVLWGMQLSFLVYAGVVVWVFMVHSSLRAWAGVLSIALLLLPLALWAGRFGAWR